MKTNVNNISLGRNVADQMCNKTLCNKFEMFSFSVAT